MQSTGKWTVIKTGMKIAKQNWIDKPDNERPNDCQTKQGSTIQNKTRRERDPRQTYRILICTIYCRTTGDKDYLKSTNTW